MKLKKDIDKFYADCVNNTYTFPKFYRGPPIFSVFVGILMDVKQYKQGKTTLFEYNNGDPYPKIEIDTINSILENVDNNLDMTPWNRFLMLHSLGVFNKSKA
jgi:hypothetical protein